MDLGLGGRVAIVTGSSRGIGRAIAASLADEGARLVVNARGAEALQTVADDLTTRGTDVLAVAADVTTTDGCQEVFDRTFDRFGQVDILVNNAGGGAAASIQAPESEWQDAIDLTFWSALRLTRLVVPVMQRQRSGAIIMIASIYGRELGGRLGYQVVKSAEISLAKGLARELAPSNIRVLSVAPGSILFPGGGWWRRQQDDPEAMAEFVRRDMPLGRFGAPEEVANVVTFLCSERASLVTGASVPVDGCQGRSLI
jgi:3-oxoacyl-[acyl-carrier protein] reductase